MPNLLQNNAPLTWLGLALLVSGCLSLAAPAVDRRRLSGTPVWYKPAKFAFSLSIYAFSLAWLWPLWRLAPAESFRLTLLFGAVSVIEFGLITMQAARGVRSHFNSDTPFDLAVFSVMGLVIMANTLAVAGLAARTLGQPLFGSSGYLIGVQWGLVAFLLGSLVGIVMSVRGGHAVPGPDGSTGLPFLGWSTRMGDLRPAHALGLHGLQLLPLAGLLFDRLQLPLFPTHLLGISLITITLLALTQALAGRPLASGILGPQSGSSTELTLTKGHEALEAKPF